MIFCLNLHHFLNPATMSASGKLSTHKYPDNLLGHSPSYYPAPQREDVGIIVLPGIPGGECVVTANGPNACNGHSVLWNSHLEQGEMKWQKS